MGFDECFLRDRWDGMESTISLCSAQECACTPLWHSSTGCLSAQGPSLIPQKPQRKMRSTELLLSHGRWVPQSFFQLCKSFIPGRAWLEGASSLPRLTVLPSSSRAIYLERAQRGPSKAMTNAWLIPSREAKQLPRKQSLLLSWPRLWQLKRELALTRKNKHFPHLRSERAALLLIYTCRASTARADIGHWVHQGPATEHWGINREEKAGVILVLTSLSVKCWSNCSVFIVSPSLSPRSCCLLCGWSVESLLQHSFCSDVWNSSQILQTPSGEAALHLSLQRRFWKEQTNSKNGIV